MDSLVNAGGDAGDAGFKPGGRKVAGQRAGDAADGAGRVAGRRAQKPHRGQRPDDETAADGQNRQRRATHRQPPLKEDNQRAGGEGK